MPISRPIKYALLLAAIAFVLRADPRAWTMEHVAEQSNRIPNDNRASEGSCDAIGCN